VVKLTSTFVV